MAEVSGGASQDQLDALRDTIPLSATTMPPGVADTGAQGAAERYARADHTHASKARKEIKLMPSATATYVWVYPVPFAPGTVPICNAIVQVMGVPTNTQVTFQINRVSSGLLALLTGALALNPNPVAATLHMLALEP